MRATEQRRTHLRAGLLCAALGAAGVAACADSLHLDPAGAGGGTSTGTHMDGGASCQSNPDCAYPTAVCDTTTYACVECLTHEDCSDKQGTVCSRGACACPKATESFCEMTAACVDMQTASTDCGACGHACYGSCVTGQCADKWEPLPTSEAVEGRSRHVAAWTGSQMFVWGGTTKKGPTNTGGLYDPAKRTWTQVSLDNAPSPRFDATAVWDDTDKLVLVWGGSGVGGPLGTGARFDPAKNQWTAMATSGAPSARHEHTAVWASSTMIVWGGTDAAGHVSDGYLYDPTQNKWTGPMVTGNGPSPRGRHSAVWDGSHMIIFGGLGVDVSAPTMPDNTPLGDAFSYSASGMWTALSTTGAPSPRYDHTAVWTNGVMIISGGTDGSTLPPAGGMLNGTTWAPLNGGPPEPRVGHTAVALSMGTSPQMIIFGGDQGGAPIAAPWSLDVATTTWSPLPSAPPARSHHTAVVDGATMIIFGGDAAGGQTNTGAIFNAAP